MANVTINSKEFKKAIKELQSKLRNATPAFRDIANLELSETKLRYKNEVDPQGKRWPNPFTIRRDGGGSRLQGQDPWGYVIASNYHAAPPGYHFFRPGSDKILMDTGTLFNSLGRAYGPNYAVIGTNVEYAKKLNSGKFQFLGINKKTMQNVESVFTFYINKAVKK